jgi:hypothetical protein
LEFIIVIKKSPKKLNIAAIKTADSADIERVETHVAMALGASVQPLTKMTAKVRIVVVINMGSVVILSKKSGNDIDMSFSCKSNIYPQLKQREIFYPVINNIKILRNYDKKY